MKKQGLKDPVNPKTSTSGFTGLKDFQDYRIFRMGEVGDYEETGAENIL